MACVPQRVGVRSKESSRAAAGGWRDVTTLLRCYTQPDDDTILAVMSEARKVMEKAVSR